MEAHPSGPHHKRKGSALDQMQVEAFNPGSGKAARPSEQEEPEQPEQVRTKLGFEFVKPQIITVLVDLRTLFCSVQPLRLASGSAGPADRLCVGSDSAGGNIAAAVA